MKKHIIIAASICSFTIASAQQINSFDGVLFAQPNRNHSARFNALSGSMGAIGADYSTIHINPAGSALNVVSSFSVTGDLNYNKSNSNFLNVRTSNVKPESFSNTNLAGIFKFDSNKRANSLKRTVVGITYDNYSNLRNDFSFKGVNQRSIGNYFLDLANTGGPNGGAVPHDYVTVRNGENISSLYSDLNKSPFGFNAQQALLGYESHILDKSANGKGYQLNVPTGPYQQESSVIIRDFNSKFTANLAFDFNHKIYVGASLNFYSLDYLKSSEILEKNTNNVTTSGVYDILFANNNRTFGNGLSFQIGAIAKLNKSIRFGLSYESSTWYELQDEIEQSLKTNVYLNGSQVKRDVTPGVIVSYNPYKFKTPSTLTASFSYLFDNKGFINIDYSRKDFTAISYNDYSGGYSAVNSIYKDVLQASNQIRVGGEYRVGNWRLRAGYRFEQSPYKNGTTLSNLHGYSTGFGYAFSGSSIDFSFSQTKQSMEIPLISSGVQDFARINNRLNVFAVTYNIYL